MIPLDLKGRDPELQQTFPSPNKGWASWVAPRQTATQSVRPQAPSTTEYHACKQASAPNPSLFGKYLIYLGQYPGMELLCRVFSFLRNFSFLSQASLDLKSFSLNLPISGIKDVSYHTWPSHSFHEQVMIYFNQHFFKFMWVLAKISQSFVCLKVAGKIALPENWRGSRNFND